MTTNTLARREDLALPKQGIAGGMLSDFSDLPIRQSALGTYLSLYAGAGGLDIGFALAGWRPAWVNEYDTYAAETHDAVFKRLADELPHLRGTTHEMVAGSIIDAIEGDDLPGRGEVDLVIGGPPCQGFSVAGKMNPDDARSEHVFRFFDVVERVQPQAFVFENVKALYENQRWADVRHQLKQRATRLGYTHTMFLLNAADFGVPQARERMFFVGVSTGSIRPPVPTTHQSQPTIREAFAQLPPFNRPGNDSLCAARITTAKNPVLRRSPFAGMLFNGAGRPMDADAPSLTLAASMGGNKTPIVDQQQLDDGSDHWVIGYHRHLMNGGKPIDTVPSNLRRITVEEAAALQTFPLGMDWRGPQSSQYRQIGNAVPPRLAAAVARAVNQSMLR